MQGPGVGIAEYQTPGKWFGVRIKLYWLTIFHGSKHIIPADIPFKHSSQGMFPPEYLICFKKIFYLIAIFIHSGILSLMP